MSCFNENSCVDVYMSISPVHTSASKISPKDNYRLYAKAYVDPKIMTDYMQRHMWTQRQFMSLQTIYDE